MQLKRILRLLGRRLGNSTGVQKKKIFSVFRNTQIMLIRKGNSDKLISGAKNWYMNKSFCTKFHSCLSLFLNPMVVHNILFVMFCGHDNYWEKRKKQIIHALIWCGVKLKWHALFHTLLNDGSSFFFFSPPPTVTKYM